MLPEVKSVLNSLFCLAFCEDALASSRLPCLDTWKTMHAKYCDKSKLQSLVITHAWSWHGICLPAAWLAIAPLTWQATPDLHYKQTTSWGQFHRAGLATTCCNVHPTAGQSAVGQLRLLSLSLRSWLIPNQLFWLFALTTFSIYVFVSPTFMREQLKNWTQLLLFCDRFVHTLLRLFSVK